MNIQNKTEFENAKDPHKHGNDAFPIAVYKVVDTPKKLYGGVGFVSLPLHWHDEAEIFYLRRGECQFYINGEMYNLHEGCALLIQPKIMHRAYISDSDINTVSIAAAFHPRMLSGYAGDIINTKYLSNIFNQDKIIEPMLSPDVPWQNEILCLYRQLLGFYDETICPDDDDEHRDELLSLDEGSDCAEIKIKSLLLDIFYIYMKNAEIKNAVHKSSKSAYKYLLKSIDYIHEHYSEKITLSDLATCAFMSDGYYSRVFMEYMRCRPFEYLNSYRVNKSLELLSDVTVKIIDIASRCGFVNISYYNRIFRELMKCTPTEYRYNKYGT